MNTCGARCEAERRSCCRDLQKWSRNMLYIVGLECVAKRMAKRHEKRAPQETPEDWQAPDKCAVCATDTQQNVPPAAAAVDVCTPAAASAATATTGRKGTADTDTGFGNLDSLGEALQRAAQLNPSSKPNATAPLNFDAVFQPPAAAPAPTYEMQLQNAPYALHPYAHLLGFGSAAQYLQMLQWTAMLHTQPVLPINTTFDFAALNANTNVNNNNLLQQLSAAAKGTSCTSNTQQQQQQHTARPTTDVTRTQVKAANQPAAAVLMQHHNGNCEGRQMNTNKPTGDISSTKTATTTDEMTATDLSLPSKQLAKHTAPSPSPRSKPEAPVDDLPLDLSNKSSKCDPQEQQTTATAAVNCDVLHCDNQDDARPCNAVLDDGDDDGDVGGGAAGNNKRAYTQMDLEQAVKDIDTKKMGTRRAAIKYGIPRSTLRNKMAKLKATENGMPSPKRSRRVPSGSPAALSQADCSNDSVPSPESPVNEEKQMEMESPQSEKHETDRIQSTIEQTVIAAQGVDFSLKWAACAAAASTTTNGSSSRPATADIDDRVATMGDALEEQSACSAHSADDAKHKMHDKAAHGVLSLAHLQTRPKRGQYRKYDKKALDEAVQAVRRGEMKVHRAGSYYGVPHSTLEYKVKERNMHRTGKKNVEPQQEVPAAAADETGKASDTQTQSTPSADYDVTLMKQAAAAMAVWSQALAAANKHNTSA